jgi:hypothetical protein
MNFARKCCQVPGAGHALITGYCILHNWTFGPAENKPIRFQSFRRILAGMRSTHKGIQSISFFYVFHQSSGKPGC